MALAAARQNVEKIDTLEQPRGHGVGLEFLIPVLMPAVTVDIIFTFFAVSPGRHECQLEHSGLLPKNFSNASTVNYIPSLPFPTTPILLSLVSNAR